MNFVMISPNFPTTYWRFAEALKKNGLNVLGVGDTPYHELSPELKNNLTEYYFLADLNNYKELFKAIAHFSFKYGKIDWLESNNEYWLEYDARLREDFNIKTGFLPIDIQSYKKKSLMKDYFKKAKVVTARFELVTTIAKANAFIKKVGYPIFVKPNIGVGANHSYKIGNVEDLKAFFAKPIKTEYIMEEFIDGQVVSFDGVANSKSEVVFCASNEFPVPNFEIVNDVIDDFYYTVPQVDQEFVKIGQKTVKAFNVKQRYFHIEFFRLNKDKKGLGKKGDIIGLEANLRPPGGLTPEMINAANNVSSYSVYADVIAFDKSMQKESLSKFYVAEAARRDKNKYANSNTEVIEKYKASIILTGRYPTQIAVGMGEQYFIAKFASLIEVLEFREFTLKHK